MRSGACPAHDLAVDRDHPPTVEFRGPLGVRSERAGTGDHGTIAYDNAGKINGILGVTGQTTTPGGATVNFVRDPSGTLIAMHTGGASYYYTTDAIGSVIALTDANQTVVAKYHYTPWGTTSSATGSMATANPWRYAGGYYDSQTGYTKMGTRYYNPSIGRFAAPDPNSTWGGYSYANNNPVTNTDPTGRDWLDDTLSVVSTVASVGATVADATGIGAPVGLALGGIATAASAGQAAYDCGEGSESCGDSVAIAAGSALTFGAGAVLGIGTAADVVGDAGATASDLTDDWS